jgi:hypothetical protein
MGQLQPNDEILLQILCRCSQGELARQFVIVRGAAWIEPEKAPLYSIIPAKAGIHGGASPGLRRNDECARARPVPATGGWQRAVQPSYPAPVTGRRDCWRATAGTGNS